ncbi:MAG: tRNA-dihydrouridine synthase [Candidatus Nomurabacteria bacterium]|jgi:tRNA-dihydrouridine synthase|nr:tRNA-dihydrouridine synthase [Candidatus Nomurabacteria bacterium]
MNFWQTLPRPFFALAPMEAASDVVFRRTLLEAGRIARESASSNDQNENLAQHTAGRPDVFFTEFTNATSFCSSKGEPSTRGRLVFAPDEQPIVAQIWGSRPDNFYQMAKSLRQRGFAGVDLNTGCPDKAVVKSGGGSALIENPLLAVEIIQAIQAGWRDGENSIESAPTQLSKKQPTLPASSNPNFDDRSSRPSLRGSALHFSSKKKRSPKLRSDNAYQSNNMISPISVKTRLGAHKVDEWRPWLTTLLRQNLANLTIHLRTRKEMSKVPAHYELIDEIVQLRNQIAPATRLTINGDVRDRAHGRAIFAAHPGVDGLMIGRGAFANPFCFTDLQNPTRAQLIRLLRFQLDQFDKWRKICEIDSRPIIRKFDPLKRFFKIYIKDFDGAKELREKVFACRTTDEVRAILAAAGL